MVVGAFSYYMIDANALLLTSHRLFGTTAKLSLYWRSVISSRGDMPVVQALPGLGSLARPICSGLIKPASNAAAAVR